MSACLDVCLSDDSWRGVVLAWSHSWPYQQLLLDDGLQYSGGCFVY